MTLPPARALTSPAVGDELTPVYAIQGEGEVSPLVGRRVATTGVVSAVDGNGFYLQDASGDGDPATSDALFVFTGSAPTVSVGDAVRVDGTVSEFVPGGSGTGNLPTTQLGGGVSVGVEVGGTALPEAVTLGPDGRLPPTRGSGIAFFESLEGMRVTVDDSVAVGPTSAFGEIFSVTQGRGERGLNATNLSQRGTLNVEGGAGGPEVTNTAGPRADFNPERIQIDDDADLTPAPTPFVGVGTRLDDVTGVLGYSFGNHEVLATEAITLARPSRLEPETSRLEPGDGRLTVASYNLLNLDPKVEDAARVDGQDPGEIDDDVGAGRFALIGRQIAGSLHGPDIIALQEVQDNDGAEISDVTAADATLGRLVEAIAAAGGPDYAFLDNPFIGNGTGGGQPGGNIRTAFLYNPLRVELDAGSVRTVTDPAQQIAQSQELDAWAPGLNPFLDARLPLAATFRFGGEEVTVVGNHFTSKGGSTPLFGTEQPPINGGEPQRIAQAEAVNGFVDGILAEDRGALVVVAGDLNEFEFEEPLAALTTGAPDGRGDGELANLTLSLSPDERYSYIFEGNSQSLDHILASPELARAARFDAVHVNSEFAETDARASDHDPLLASFRIRPDNDGDWLFA